MTIEEFGTKSHMAVTRDGNNNRVIQGKTGNIHEDGNGFSIFVSMKSKAGIRKAHEALKDFCERRQDGDTEAVYFSRLKCTKAELDALFKFCRIRRLPTFSDEVIAKFKQRGAILGAKVKEKHTKTTPNVV